MPSINLGKVVGTVDTNTPITFDDYTSTTAPEPEEALSKITSPNTIGNLFKYIKGFLNNAIHKNDITNSIDTNDSTKVPSSTVTYGLNETKVDKNAIVHNADVDDGTKIPGMDLIHNIQEQVTTLNNNLTTNTINYIMESEPTRFMNCVIGSVDITSNSYFGDVQFILKVHALDAYTDYTLAYSTIHPKQQCTMFVQSDRGKRIKVALYTDGRLFVTPIDSVEENEFIVCHFAFAI